MKSKGIIILFFLQVITMSMNTQKKSRIVFFGDSITQMGMDAGGYIREMEATIKSRNLSAGYELAGAGIGGNKVYDLYLRMENDVLAKNPDVVVIWIGVNDIWHKTSGIGTDPQKFQQFYEAIIKKFQARNIRLFLCTPTAIGERTDYSNPQDGDLNFYSNIIRSLSKKFNTGLIDLRKAFLEYNMGHNPDNKESGILTTDRVHLNPAGNKLVADKMLEVLLAK